MRAATSRAEALNDRQRARDLLRKAGVAGAKYLVVASEDDAWNAEVALQDARTALDAASAELRSATAAVDGGDAATSSALLALQHDIDLLRGTADDDPSGVTA